MTEADCYRDLARAVDDIVMHRNLLVLLPWTVHVDREAEWAELVRRDAQLRAVALARIPTPRAPIDPRPRVGAPRPGGHRWHD